MMIDHKNIVHCTNELEIKDQANGTTEQQPDRSCECIIRTTNNRHKKYKDLFFRFSFITLKETHKKSSSFYLYRNAK